MNPFAPLRNWLVDPPMTGIPALVCAIATVAVPTLIRVSVDGMVVGCESIVYIPFILLSAIFLGWRYTALVALASAVIIDTQFIGPRHGFMESAGDLFGVGGFLIASALITGFVEGVRSIVRDLIREKTSGIVFSSADGHAWASWYGRSARVHLGKQSEVAEMMEDFLAQVEVAKRLTRNAGRAAAGSSEPPLMKTRQSGGG